MDMGTGKTRTAIDIALRRVGRIKRVVWFTLVSLKETVQYEIKKHTTASDSDIYMFDDKTTDITLPEAAWYIIGLESLSGSTRVMLAANVAITEDSMVIVDESNYIKGNFAKRTRRVTTLACKARYRLILTGTPISQGVQDLYSQMYFLSPKILGYNSWYSFARNHLEYSDKYLGQIVAAHNTEWLAAKIAPYTYQVTKDECLNLPEKLHENYCCFLSNEQIEQYSLAKKEFEEEMLRMDDGRQFLPSLPIFKLFTGLQSIVCGFVGRANGVLALKHNRLHLLTTALAAISPGEHVVVWAKYHFCREEISEAIQDRPVYQYHGRVNERQRHHELQRWRKNGGMLIATQDAGGHGLDLTDACQVIFYANGFKYSTRIQAEDRFHRIGQTRPVTYIDLWADCGIERRIENAIIRKGNAVEDFRREVDAVKTERKGAIKKLLERL